MGDFSRSGGRVPRDPEVEAEHRTEMADAVRRDREAAKAMGGRDRPRRPWWKLWAKR